jgi:hypothetical protein
MPPAVQQPEWVQYGSFGLVAFAVIVLIPTGFYVLKILFDRMMAAFERVVVKLCATFEEESKACREERMETADKDRTVRHDMANAIQKLNAQLEVSYNRGNHPG